MRFASGPLYVSHSIPAKVEGEALALGKAEALAQHSELRTHRASYRKLHQSPRHWAPDHPMKRPMPTLAIPDTLPPLFCFLPPLLFFFFCTLESSARARGLSGREHLSWLRTTSQMSPRHRRQRDERTSAQ